LKAGRRAGGDNKRMGDILWEEWGGFVHRGRTKITSLGRQRLVKGERANRTEYSP